MTAPLKVVKRAETARIDADVLANAKIAAGFRGIPLSEYITAILAPVAERDVKEGIARWEQQAAAGGS